MKKIILALFVLMVAIMFTSCDSSSEYYECNSSFPVSAYPPPAENRMILASDKTPVIEARGGSATIANARKTFPGYIDPKFKEWGLNKPGKASSETSIRIWRLNDQIGPYEVAPITLNAAYRLFQVPLENLCFTQSQIIYLCQTFPEKISPLSGRGSKGTFFLLKEKNHYYVAKVSRDGDGLGISAYHLNERKKWKAEQYLFVVPAAK